jgi:hypothetical protein
MPGLLTELADRARVQNSVGWPAEALIWRTSAAGSHRGRTVETSIARRLGQPGPGQVASAGSPTATASIANLLPGQAPELGSDKRQLAVGGVAGSKPNAFATATAPALLRTPSLLNIRVWMFSTVFGAIPSRRAVWRIE